MPDQQKKPTAAERSSDRTFGFVFACLFLLIAILPLMHGHAVRPLAIVAGLIFGFLALVNSAVLAPLNRLWTEFGMLLHRIVSPFALAVIFFGVIMPIALVMRVLGKDPLRLRFDRAAPSYWVERTPPGPDAQSLKNQF